MNRVAVLFADPDGVYANLDGVDLWDEARDARRYAGPWPVVAHPPCARWSLMGLCRGYYDGEDEGCFESALHAVRTYGGVLEHPAHSLAWKRFGLPYAARNAWASSFSFEPEGFSTEVDQWAYGLKLRKPTWLYFVGEEPTRMDWRQAKPFVPILRHHSGWGTGQADRSATPPAFRDVLLAMARTSNRDGRP